MLNHGNDCRRFYKRSRKVKLREKLEQKEQELRILHEAKS